VPPAKISTCKLSKSPSDVSPDVSPELSVRVTRNGPLVRSVAILRPPCLVQISTYECPSSECGSIVIDCVSLEVGKSPNVHLRVCVCVCVCVCVRVRVCASPF
jgi:hypothetical protein